MSSKSDIPIAILCGGYGTRSGQPINKCFVDVNGKPFILYIMEQMEAQGYNTFVICRGTGGTLTALREAREQLGERFLVCYGDTYTPLNFRHFIDAWDHSTAPAITAFHDETDAGVNGFATYLLDMLDDDVTDLKVLHDALRSRFMMYHYPAPLRWMEVGTPQALAETRELLR